jgi:hypothetical protein
VAFIEECMSNYFVSVRSGLKFVVLVWAVAVLSPVSVAHRIVRAQEHAAQAAGTLAFTDITAFAAPNTVTGSHGAAWADVTGDGLPDLYLTYNECRSGTRRNRFYRNLGGVFADEGNARGLGFLSGGSHGGAWADIDNDGDYDLLSGDTYQDDCVFTEAPLPLANRVLRNDGGIFVNRTPPSMAAYRDYTRSILSFDMDRDGDLDIFAVNGDRGSNEPSPDRNELYRNDGGSTFTAITSGPLITTPAGQAAADTDYDGDGDVDILMPDFGGFNAEAGDVGVLRNEGSGVFTRVPRTSIGIVHRATTGISSGDLNNDGLLDLVLIDQDRNPLRPLGFDRVAYIYVNVGGGTFAFRGEVRLFAGYTAGLADLDNDADLDLVLPGLPYVLVNDGNAGFTPGPAFPTPAPAPGCSGPECMRPDPRTVSFADIDGDGDLDAVVTAKFAGFRMIRNEFNAGNWVKVQLTSPQGQAGAFGAKVRVYRPGTTSLIALREAKSAYGYLSQDDPVIHIGLGAATTVDVEVTYLDGSRVLRQNVSANQTIAFVGTGVATAPIAPRNFVAAVTGSSVNLTWDASAGGGAVSAYRLDVGSGPGATDLAVIPAGAGRTLTATAPNGTYFVRVRALNAAGISPPSNEIVVTVGGACLLPAAPTNPTFIVAGLNVTLNWVAPTSGATPTSYVIEAGSSSGAADLASFDTGSPVTGLAAVAPPGRYHVRVRGRTACGLGPPSTEMIVNVP